MSQSTSQSTSQPTSVATNADRLLTQVLTGQVWPQLVDRFGYRVDANGEAFLLPGMGGVTLGVRWGDPVSGYAADHLEPGLSVRHPSPAADAALQMMACVGNEVRVLGGLAAGEGGRVTGQHAYLLVDAPDRVLARMAPGDWVSVRARGQGLRLLGHPDVVVVNLDPDLLAAMPVRTGPDGRLRVPVAALVPPSAIGAGAGMSTRLANVDLMGVDEADADLSLGLGGLRVGDLVALQDQDHRFGRGFRPGHLSVAVMTTGQCALFGHGPGASTLLTGPAAAFDLRTDQDANLAAYTEALT